MQQLCLLGLDTGLPFFHQGLSEVSIPRLWSVWAASPSAASWKCQPVVQIPKTATLTLGISWMETCANTVWVPCKHIWSKSWPL